MPEKTNNPTELVAPHPIEGVVVVKIAVLAAAFLASMALFAYACSELLGSYSLVFAPSEATVPWLIRMGVGALLVMLLFGVMAVLVRPKIITVAILVAGAVVYALVLGGGYVAWNAAVFGAALLLALLLTVAKQLDNQIDFTLHPISGKELMLSSILAILVAVPVGLGYAVESERGQYVFPPRLTTYLQDGMNAGVEKMVEAQSVPVAFREATIQAAKEQVVVMVSGFEKSAEPFAPFFPYALGLLAYFTAQIALVIPGLIASTFLGPLIALLKLTRFAHMSKEVRTVTRVTLSRKPEPVPVEPGKDPWTKAV